MLELIARKSELIVSFCAMITSVISLFIAYKAQVHQQKHNQLSVKPLAEFLIGDYEDVIFIKIKNQGTGPLIVKEFLTQDSSNSYDRIMDAISEIKLNILWERFTDNIDGRIIAVDKELILLQASFEASEKRLQKIIRSELSLLELNLTYNDIYGIEQPKLAKKLDWFSR
ncbi:hypothetical protein H4F75_10275 [Enterobacter asburiae]|uniref:hypothetical protein n=1 Tax=Enterobacter TaxID=547 RepID=UPI000F88F553|nr:MULTISPECIES: hypothetical protein [Enterobacter]ELP5715284.1 hypothetical protein [Enterobacter asburiae]EMA4737695.1 hypothetical protein [Enterobacter asburiae]MBN4799855.1 hypothetical protein [Enterobacter asburiae]MBN4804725.1 hypothetical protein [Enterobacter asburiae]RTP86993.1 hypothetical protein EKN34_13560 [Enterobacter asburiae]